MGVATTRCVNPSQGEGFFCNTYLIVVIRKGSVDFFSAFLIVVVGGRGGGGGRVYLAFSFSRELGRVFSYGNEFTLLYLELKWLELIIEGGKIRVKEIGWASRKGWERGRKKEKGR